MNSVPMAFIRTLARRKVRDLTVVAIVHGMPIEWLVAAGCVRSVVSGLVSLEGFGLAPRFRAAVQATRGRDRGVQRAHTDLPAPGRGLPASRTCRRRRASAPTCSPSTPRRPASKPTRTTGEPYVACTPLPVDVAIVHAEAADTRGNVRVDPKLVWMDSELVKAAATTIVTVERIVPEASFRAEPHRTTYPRFTIDTVVEAPWGAYPTSCFPRYSLRRRLLPRLRRRAHRPRRRPGLLARADRRARDARRVPGCERRPAHAALDRPEDVVTAAYTIDELMVTTLAREFTNDTRAFNGAVSFVPVCAYLLARRTHAPDLAWAASSIAIDADPKSIPESTLSDGLWDGASDARQLGLRLLGLRAEPPLQHLRLPRRPDGRLRQRQQHDDRAVRRRRRCACRAAAGWRT